MHSIGAQKAKHQFNRRLIKSTRSGVITIPSGSTFAFVSLAIPVDKTKSIILFNGFYTSTASNQCEIMPRVELSNGSTVFAYVNSASSNSQARNVRYFIVEFHAWAISNIDHGTITVSNTTSNTAAAAFTPRVAGNTVCIYLGNTTNATGDSGRLSSSHIEVSQSGGIITGQYDSSQTPSCSAGYCLVEFSPGIIQSRNEALFSITSGNASATSTISSVVPGNTLTFWGGCRYSDGFTTEEVLGYLSDATHFTAERVSTASSNSKIRLTAMEFYPKWVKQIQRGRTTMTSGTATTDTAITQSAAGNTILSFLGHKAQNSFSNTEYTYPAIGDQSATSIRTQRDTATDFTLVPTASWEAMEAA